MRGKGDREEEGKEMGEGGKGDGKMEGDGGREREEGKEMGRWGYGGKGDGSGKGIERGREMGDRGEEGRMRESLILPLLSRVYKRP